MKTTCVMAAFAELKRAMIRERTMAGLAAARAQGRADEESPTRIAKALGGSRASIYRHLPASNT